MVIIDIGIAGFSGKMRPTGGRRGPCGEGKGQYSLSLSVITSI